MLLSYKHKFIFVHNYKVAGTSVKKALAPYALLNPPHLRFVSQMFENNRWMESQGRRVVRKLGMPSFHGHDRAKVIRATIGNEQWDEMFTFGFVRNPWDWQVSLYHYTLKFEDHHQHELIKGMKDFDEYIDWRVNHDLKLQSEAFIDNSRKVIVDFIGKMENLGEDFAKITSAIGLNDVKLPHSNKSKHKKYTEYYTPRTRKLIADHFAEDIERFKYTFE